MKKIILQIWSILIILLSIPHFVFAQIDWKKQCGTILPSTTSVSKIDTIVNGDSVIIIPTVFHILTQGGAENISRSTILKALDQLNKDYSRQNQDTISIPAPFHPLRGNPKVEFRLARIDPQGNCTDGIDRIYTPLTGAINNFLQVQPNFAWDHTLYLNIYVLNWMDYYGNVGSIGASYVAPVDSGLNSSVNEDALVLCYFTLGDGFNGVQTGMGGHVISHEMGHSLSLMHIWFDAGCSNDDLVSDTPLQDNFNLSYPAFPQISCSNGPNGDMFNNFMDYSECVNMFTEGQVDRMRTCLANNEWRNSLWASTNLTASGVDSIFPVCANPPVADFGYGNYAGWLCAGTPVQFYEASTWSPTSYQWEFTGGIPATSTDTFPSVVFPNSGMYSVKLIVSNSFGVDTIEKPIRIEPAEVYYNLSLIETFEDSVFNQQIPPYTLLGKKWSVTNLAAYSGTQSILLDSSLKFLSCFFTHIYDLNQLPSTNRKLEFKVACGLSFAGSIAGGLRVTWKRPCAYERYEIFGQTEYGVEGATLHPGDVILPDSLRTAITNSVFIPNSSQWKTITLDIPDSLTGEIQIGFDWLSFTATNKLKGLYIDDIKIFIAPSGIAENASGFNWSLFPNPGTNQLTISLPNNFTKVTATISDITGKVIYKTIATTTQKIEINTSNFAEGVYLVQIQTEKFIETKKVIVTK